MLENQLNSCDSLIDRIEMKIDLDGSTLGEWMTSYRSQLIDKIEREGAVLLRGLKVVSSAQFGKLTEQIFNKDLLTYTNRSTPRTQLKGNVFTSTEYPQQESIPLHNENSYSHEWAMKIAFFCLVASRAGGETPIADSRKIYQKIPREIRDKFEKKGVMYVRNYGKMGLPWQEVFQVESEPEVEAYCRSANIEFSWKKDGGLKTWQICPAVQKHPFSGERVWFNQAHLFHISNLPQENRMALVDAYGEAELPRHSFYGDGEEIELDVLDCIRKVIESEKIKFQWSKGDLLLLDNMLFCHGREPYEGARKILVSMAEPRALT